MSLGLFFTALLFLTGLYFILNTGSIALAIAFDQRTEPFAIWRNHFLPLWLTYFGGAIVAALLFVLISSGVADPIVLVLVVPIPLILYAAFKSAVGRLGDQFEHLGHVNKMYLATIGPRHRDQRKTVSPTITSAVQAMRSPGAGARRQRRSHAQGHRSGSAAARHG